MSLLDDFDRDLPLYEAFRHSVEGLLKDLVRIELIQVHSVNSRIKSRDSFAEKIEREGKEPYENLADVTDIVGIRVITHIEDDVDKIGSLIEREFLLDQQNSVDKRQAMDPDRFGYLSLHYVCGMVPARTQLAENRRFEGLKFEVQVRSILQHAWAEIEHDLGYKSGSTIPAAMRRRFSRLAGLLEIADNEFRRLRDDLEGYALQIESQIEREPQHVELNDVSLQSFIASQEALKALDSEMASRAGQQLESKAFDDLAGQLKFVGVKSIEELANLVDEYRPVVLGQWARRLEMKGSRDTGVALRRGLGLFHLWQVLAVQQGGAVKLIQGFENYSRKIKPARAEVLSALIREELRVRGID